MYWNRTILFDQSQYWKLLKLKITEVKFVKTKTRIILHCFYNCSQIFEEDYTVLYADLNK